jgi:hypothetical protein
LVEGVETVLTAEDLPAALDRLEVIGFEVLGEFLEAALVHFTEMLQVFVDPFERCLVLEFADGSDVVIPVGLLRVLLIPGFFDSFFIPFQDVEFVFLQDF